jgi:hypothetical protein
VLHWQRPVASMLGVKFSTTADLPGAEPGFASCTFTAVDNFAGSLLSYVHSYTSRNASAKSGLGGTSAGYGNGRSGCRLLVLFNDWTHAVGAAIAAGRLRGVEVCIMNVDGVSQSVVESTVESLLLEVNFVLYPNEYDHLPEHFVPSVTVVWTSLAACSALHPEHTRGSEIDLEVAIVCVYANPIVEGLRAVLSCHRIEIGAHVGVDVVDEPIGGAVTDRLGAAGRPDASFELLLDEYVWSYVLSAAYLSCNSYAGFIRVQKSARHVGICSALGEK